MNLPRLNYQRPECSTQKLRRSFWRADVFWFFYAAPQFRFAAEAETSREADGNFLGVIPLQPPSPEVPPCFNALCILQGREAAGASD